ncbi:baseplate protein [Neiella marina]|uniref:Baseplate protein n=1 Tax=Neiella marina TaxID=508461 RepID=A0A8J2U790_9GAMM|nr:GPW/gp25 family protein [Neiella marina]GGA83725.1 baseplate protein [Neiella marina]
MSNQGFLGKGWQFPPNFSRASGQVSLVEGEQDIEQSLRILLATNAGERFLVPEYGLDMQSQLFESPNSTARNLLKDRIVRTLLIHEPRIKVLQLTLDDSNLNEGKLILSLDYQIRASNSRFNLVYPYYLTDGTEVSPKV